MSVIDLPLDTLRLAFDELDFMSQLRLISCCKYFRQNLTITDLFNIGARINDMLTDDILKTGNIF